MAEYVGLTGMGNLNAKNQPKKVILATHNAGKVRELAAAVEGWEFVGMGELGLPIPDENGVTFQDNADIKAAAALEKTGLWALADDSGLEVNALGGGPGVKTADFGGWERLLEVMKDVPDEARGAQFVCVLALHTGASVLHFTGVCRGRIGRQGRGEGGFGYDPVFFPDGFEVTFAEMSKAQKSAISHRGKAVAALQEWVLTQAEQSA